MGYRNIIVESPATLSVSHSQLIEILIGPLTEADDSFQFEQLSIF